VPGDAHRLDVKIYKQRYPDMLVVTPPGALKRVEKAVGVDATDIDSAIAMSPGSCFGRRRP